MAQRSKVYTRKLLVLDIILLLITAGGWAIIMLVRELYRWR